MWNSLGDEADDILDQKFVNNKQQENAILEQIKEKYNYDQIRNTFNEAAVPTSHIFSVVEKIVISTRQLKFYRQAMKTENLLHFYYLIRDKI